ncbi:hypothetical protein E2C01_102518 [Portunus trituberculatus]|uniref:Uncharacterized protein n=1 Tax=Portunus trituberculatus TaxID=210409 RepID=A0A5B7KDJ0_PORTR|nr:hypothetical protein [Portunus trituberculatus]
MLACICHNLGEEAQGVWCSIAHPCRRCVVLAEPPRRCCQLASDTVLDMPCMLTSLSIMRAFPLPSSDREARRGEARRGQPRRDMTQPNTTHCVLLFRVLTC